MIHKTKKYLTNTDIKRYFDTKNTENINIYYYTTLRKKKYNKQKFTVWSLVYKDTSKAVSLTVLERIARGLKDSYPNSSVTIIRETSHHMPERTYYLLATLTK